MGCDIHLHVEVKIDGEWHHYNHPDIGRNYRIFGMMAGVRCHDVDPIAYPKGLPDDMSKITRMNAEQWGRDGHSHSWLSSKEVLRLTEEICGDEELAELGRHECCTIWGFLFGNTYSGFMKHPLDIMPGVQDFRFVFWFDN